MTGAPEGPLRHRALQAIGWSMTAGLTTMALSFVGNVVLARLVGPVAFGQFAFAVAIVAVIFLAGGFVSYEAIVQCRTEDEDGLGGTALILGLILACLLGCISGGAVWLASAEVPPPERRALCLLGFSSAVTMVGYVIAALQMRRLRFRALALATILGTVVSLIVAIAMARRGLGVRALVGREVINAIVVIGTLSLSASLPGILWRRSAFDTIRPVGAGMCVARGTDEGFGRIDNIIVGAVLGPAALGFYAQAYRLALVGYQSTVGLVQPVLLSVYARLEPGRRNRVLVINVAWMGRLFPLIGLLVWYEGSVVVQKLFGQEWLTAGRLFALFGPFLTLRAFEANLRSFLMAAGQLKAVVRSRLVVLAIFIPAVGWSATAFGLSAVVWAVTGCMGLLVVFMYVLVSARCDLLRWEFLVRPAIATVVTVAAAGLIGISPAAVLLDARGGGVLESAALVIGIYTTALVLMDASGIRGDVNKLRSYLGLTVSRVSPVSAE